MCFSKSNRGRVESSFLQFRGQVACRSSPALLGSGLPTADGEITGVEPAQVTDKLNKQAASSMEAPLDRSAASCSGRATPPPSILM